MMKLFEINGTIKCGHRLFNLQKMVVATSRTDALNQYLTEHPNAKGISIKYKYDLKSEVTPHIVFANYQKNS